MTILKTGDEVRVEVNRTQDKDVPPDPKFDKRKGRVKKVDTDGCCGSTPEDPAYSVAVAFIGTDLFWREELVKTQKRREK